MDTGHSEWIWAVDNCSVIQMTVSLPLVPEPSSQPIPKLNPWDQLPSKGPRLQDPCLIHRHLQCLVQVWA